MSAPVASRSSSVSRLNDSNIDLHTNIVNVSMQSGYVSPSAVSRRTLVASVAAAAICASQSSGGLPLSSMARNTRIGIGLLAVSPRLSPRHPQLASQLLKIDARVSRLLVKSDQQRNVARGA